MTTYFGDFAEDDTVNIPFNTFDSNDPAASATITNLADSDIHVHKDGSITQAVTDGATVVINFDGITGNHMITIDTSADAFYATGSEYAVRVEGTTVDAGTINAWVGSFSIERAGGALALVKALNDVAATDIVSAGAITTLTGAVVNVDLVDLVTTTTTNTDVRGTDSALLAASINLTAGAVDNVTTVANATAVAGTAAFFQDFFTVDSGEVSGNEVSGSVLLEGTKINWDRVLTGMTHNINNSAGRRLRTLSGIIITDGTAQSGGNNTIQLASGDVTIDGQFTRSKVIITGGTGQGQEGVITDSVASTDTVTVAIAWLVNPDNTSDYDIIPAQSHATVRNGGYDNALVYVDTVNGVSGTQKGVNGTSTNPSSNLTDAYVIGTQQSITAFAIEPGSSVTLPSDSSNKQFIGVEYSIALNGQNIDGAAFSGANLSGTATGGSDAPTFILCGIGTVTLPPCNGFQCGFFGTFTLQTEGNYTFGGSANVFDITPIIDYGSGMNASEFYLQSWGGGPIEIQNAGAGTGTYKFQMSAIGGDLTINANCSATTEVILRGHVNLTNNASGITMTEEVNYSAANVNAEVDTGLTDYDAPTNTEMIARTLATADYFDPANDAVANVTLVATTTTNTDMVGTDGASTHSAADVWAVATRVLTANTNLNDPTTAEITTAIEAIVIETGFTIVQALQVIAAAAAGKLSGAATTTNTMRSLDDTANRIVATVDSDGNRSAVTHNV